MLLTEKKNLTARLQEQKSPVKISQFKINFYSPTQDIVINQGTESIQEGQTYLFKHIKVKDNQNGERYVNPTKNSSTYSATVSQQHEEPLPDAKVLPDTIMQTDAIICATIFKACFACNARIIEKNGQASCTKCRMSVKLQLCKSQCFMKVLFMTIQERKNILFQNTSK